MVIQRTCACWVVCIFVGRYVFLTGGVRRMNHLLRVEPVSSLSNLCRRTRLNQPPASLNPRSSLLSSRPSGGLALIIAGRLESPSLAPTRRRWVGFVILDSYCRSWVGFAVVGLDPRLLASARCRRPTVVFELSVVPLGHASPVLLLLVSSRHVVSSSSLSSLSCRLFLLLLLLRLVSSPLLSPHLPSCRLPRPSFS
jgi:hypothetical protein